MQEFIRRECVQYLNPGDIRSLLTTLEIFEMLMSDAVAANSDNFDKYIDDWIGPSMVYSLIWGIGGILDGDSRIKCDQFVRNVREEMGSFL